MNNDDLWRAEEETQALDLPPAPAGRIPKVQRRRALFAAGGLTVLAGVGAGVAWAAEVQSMSGSSRARAGGAGGSASGAGPSVGASASGSPTQTQGAGAGSSASAPAAVSDAPSATGSPSSTGSPSTPSTGAATGGPTLPPGTKVPTAPQWYADDGPMSIALTMDDGPDPVYTPQVLAVLQQYGIKATFNMIGRQVGHNLSLVREVSAAGHTITNHTWDHADLTKYTYAQVCSEIERCNDALSSAGQHPTIFRAPYGNWSTAVFQACAANNLRPVGWTVDPKDWSRPGVTSIVNNVMQHTRQHDIILEHDGGGDRSQTVAAMKIFIPELLGRGFHFVAM
ncbi:MAG TPA: polysaccharide deacetylase family protein [Actinocrinis sp.]|nr:polysaccharide deacetylase family protein [Actinocrinis sp.]